MRYLVFFILITIVNLSAYAETVFSNPRFGDIATFRGSKPTFHSLVFFSSLKGFDDPFLKIAQMLADMNMLVIVIDSSQYAQEINKEKKFVCIEVEEKERERERERERGKIRNANSR